MYLNHYIKRFGTLRLTGTDWKTDAAMQKKLFALRTTTWVLLNKDLDDIIKIVKSLEDAGLLIKGVIETI